MRTLSKITSDKLKRATMRLLTVKCRPHIEDRLTIIPIITIITTTITRTMQTKSVRMSLRSVVSFNRVILRMLISLERSKLSP